MHHHCEIVMPSTDDIEAAVATIMAPFDENGRDEEGYPNANTFWDWYVIGGRFAGTKAIQRYDKSAIEAFYTWCKNEGVTVSGVTCGKPTLSPASQIPKVDAKWNDMFPSDDAAVVACPLFDHSNDQYGREGRGTIAGDICPLAEAKHVTCDHIIIAGPGWVSGTEDWTGPPQSQFMLQETAWNGCNHMSVDWDGRLWSAIEAYGKQLERGEPKYRAAMLPQDAWLTVTVDYHS